MLTEQGLADARLAKKGFLKGDGNGLQEGKLIYSSDAPLVSLFILMMGGRP